MTPNFDTPEQRRRRQLPKKALFTVARASAEAQRRFLFKQRLVFFSGAFLGFFGLWAFVWLELSLNASVGWFALLAVLIFWGSSLAFRTRRRFVQVFLFLLGFLALGVAGGLFLPKGDLDSRINSAFLIGLPLLGTTINALVLKKERSDFSRFLWTGPWFLLAGLLVFFFPSNEWWLGLIGLISVLLIFSVHRTARETLQLHTPQEYWYAAADVVPGNLQAIWQSWTG